jgi:hypothetical protein
MSDVFIILLGCMSATLRHVNVVYVLSLLVLTRCYTKAPQLAALASNITSDSTIMCDLVYSMSALLLFLCRLALLIV